MSEIGGRTRPAYPRRRSAISIDTRPARPFPSTKGWIVSNRSAPSRHEDTEHLLRYDDGIQAISAIPSRRGPPARRSARFGIETPRDPDPAGRDASLSGHAPKRRNTVREEPDRPAAYDNPTATLSPALPGVRRGRRRGAAAGSGPPPPATSSSGTGKSAMKDLA